MIILFGCVLTLILQHKMSKYFHKSYILQSRAVVEGNRYFSDMPPMIYNWSLYSSNRSLYSDFEKNKTNFNEIRDTVMRINDAHNQKGNLDAKPRISLDDSQHSSTVDETDIIDVEYNILIGDSHQSNSTDKEEVETNDAETQNLIVSSQVNSPIDETKIADTQYQISIEDHQQHNTLDADEMSSAKTQNSREKSKLSNTIGEVKTNVAKSDNNITVSQRQNELDDTYYQNMRKDVRVEQVEYQSKINFSNWNLVNEELRAAVNVSRKRIDYDKLLGCRKLPDVLIIGYEKCGTVTLKSYLGIHPEIYFRNLLWNYKLFDRFSQTSVKAYTRNKHCTPDGQLRLEKLATTGMAKKAFEVIPDIKLIAIVKEPVERSMSHYVHRIAEGIEKKPYDFDSMIGAIMDYDRPFSIKSSVLFRQSRYIDRLEPWIAYYGIDKIHVIDGDAFVKNPAVELKKVEKFLGIQPFISENNFVYNPVKKFYCLKQEGNEGCMTSNKGRPHPEMSNATRARLQDYYRPYNQKLSSIFGQNFSWNY